MGISIESVSLGRKVLSALVMSILLAAVPAGAGLLLLRHVHS
jgi:hypothetical protein